MARGLRESWERVERRMALTLAVVMQLIIIAMIMMVYVAVSLRREDSLGVAVVGQRSQLGDRVLQRV